MITAKQYTETYTRYQKMLRDYSENISKSQEGRKTLIKSTADAEWPDLLSEAVECIYAMTGDVCFYKSVINAIEKRRAEKVVLVQKAEWIQTEFDEPLSGGGQLRVRGFKCSACGGFRYKRQGMSKFCEFCGAEMGGKTNGT